MVWTAEHSAVRLKETISPIYRFWTHGASALIKIAVGTRLSTPPM
jgi:hypothetical protein